MNLENFLILRDELKVLYTGITRTKLHLVIYDDDPKKRFFLEKILAEFDLVDFEENLIDFKNKNVKRSPYNYNIF